MPKASPSNTSKTDLFAQWFFLKEAKRIDELHKKDIAAKRARAANVALSAEEAANIATGNSDHFAKEDDAAGQSTTDLSSTRSH